MPQGSRAVRHTARDEAIHGEDAAGRAVPFTHPSARLRALGLRPRKGLSQSFLADPGAAHRIVEAAALGPDDEVLEVGPGLGILTERLVCEAARVVAVELDERLALALPGIVPSRTLQVVRADVLQFDPASLFEKPYVVVANLPYHVTSPALRHLLSAGPPAPSRLVIMVQKEVAERIAAPAGELSALAVLVQARARVEIVQRVPARAFHPIPRVDSAVLRLTPLPEAQRAVAADELARFEMFLYAGFAQPRKTAGNSLAQGLAVEKSAAVSLLSRAAIDPGRRPQAIGVDEWVRLFRMSGA